MSATTIANYADATTWKEYVDAINGKQYTQDYTIFKGLAVLFTNPSCPFCKSTESDFIALAVEYPSVFFLRLEMSRPGRDQLFGAPGTMMGKEVRGTPTVFVFKPKSVVGSVVGADSKDELAEMLRSESFA